MQRASSPNHATSFLVGACRQLKRQFLRLLHDAIAELLHNTSRVILAIATPKHGLPIIDRHGVRAREAICPATDILLRIDTHYWEIV